MQSSISGTVLNFPLYKWLTSIEILHKTFYSAIGAEILRSARMINNATIFQIKFWPIEQ